MILDNFIIIRKYSYIVIVEFVLGIAVVLVVFLCWCLERRCHEVLAGVSQEVLVVWRPLEHLNHSIGVAVIAYLRLVVLASPLWRTAIVLYLLANVGHHGISLSIVVGRVRLLVGAADVHAFKLLEHMLPILSECALIQLLELLACGLGSCCIARLEQLLTTWVCGLIDVVVMKILLTKENTLILIGIVTPGQLINNRLLLMLQRLMELVCMRQNLMTLCFSL